MKIDILVLNYNGKDLLERFLPSIVEASMASSHECKVTVVDNKSTDGSKEFIRSNFPSVSFYEAMENKLLCSYNDVVEGLQSDVIIFLNDDIKLKRDFIDYLAEALKDEKVFFAAPKILNFDGSFNGGRSRLEFRWGIIKSVTELDKSETRGTTQFISCGAFRRRTFMELGGFDKLYLPGIWEDVDLCYRGLKSGYKGVYEPRSIMWHDESTTFKKVYTNREKLILAHRNMFLFLWKNISDPAMILVHIVMLIPLFLVSLMRNRTEIITGFFRALPKIGMAAGEKGESKKDFLLKDKELILWKFL